MTEKLNTLGFDLNRARDIGRKYYGKQEEQEVEPTQEPQGEQTQQTVEPIIPVIINPQNFVASDYVSVPSTNQDFAIGEINKGLNYENAHLTTLNQGLAIPTPFEFMHFHNYILDCKKNNKPIYDSAGRQLSNSIKDDLYRQLTSDCWTWLNGAFYIKDKLKSIETVIGLDARGKLLTKFTKLSPYLEENCLIDFLNLTSEGLPILKSSNQTYTKGENIYYWKPVDGKVAGFIANSGRAGLYCSGNPSDSYDDLGVRAVRR